MESQAKALLRSLYTETERLQQEQQAREAEGAQFLKSEAARLRQERRLLASEAVRLERERQAQAQAYEEMAATLKVVSALHTGGQSGFASSQVAN